MSGPPVAPQGRRSPHWIILLIAVVGSLQLFYLNFVEADRMFVHKREIARLESEVAALEAERLALEQVALHADDAVYRQQLARKQGFIFPDELKVLTQQP